MKPIYALILLMSVTIVACKKKSVTNTPLLNVKFKGCFISSYIASYNNNIDTVEVNYISDDSLSYSFHSSGVNNIYCLKIQSDSIIYNQYYQSVAPANLNIYGTYILNDKGFIKEATKFIAYDHSISNSATFSYNADGRILHEIYKYSTYTNDYQYVYDLSGNKKYRIFKQTGSVNTSDSSVYEYDLNHISKAQLGYPEYSLLSGLPDKNIVTKMTTYNTIDKSLKYINEYSYTFDADGFVTKRVTTTTTQPSGAISTVVYKFATMCR